MSDFCLSLWRFVDGVYWASHKQAGADELGKPDRWQRALAGACRQAQEQKSDHGGEDLDVDGILGTSKEGTDFQVLFDPTEQQLNPPAGFVKHGNVIGRAVQIVTNERQRLIAFKTPDGNPPHYHGQTPVASCVVTYELVLDHGEALSGRAGKRTRLKKLKANVGFGARHEDAIGLMQPLLGNLLILSRRKTNLMKT